MTEHNYPESLREVWGWKSKVYENTKMLPDKLRFFEEDTKEIIKRLGLKTFSGKAQKTGTE